LTDKLYDDFGFQTGDAMRIRMKTEGGVEVSNSDVRFEVKNGGKLLGTLTLSRGTIDWRPTRAHRGKKREAQIPWAEFDRIAKKWLET
jgi:hypothetical protein